MTEKRYLFDKEKNEKGQNIHKSISQSLDMKLQSLFITWALPYES